MLQIVGVHDFINKLTANKLSDTQTNKAVAYLRAKGIAFYDDFSRSHCAVLLILQEEKAVVLAALRYTLK